MVTLRKIDEKDYLLKLIQDMRVKARDMDDFMEERKFKKVIEKFEKGLKDEFKEY